MISVAPNNARTSPSQKVPRSFSRKINRAASATQSGDVLPSSVALAAVVNFKDEFHSAKSHAVNSPATSGNHNRRVSIRSDVLCRRVKNGTNRIVDINRREKPVIGPGASGQ